MKFRKGERKAILGGGICIGGRSILSSVFGRKRSVLGEFGCEGEVFSEEGYLGGALYGGICARKRGYFAFALSTAECVLSTPERGTLSREVSIIDPCTLTILYFTYSRPKCLFSQQLMVAKEPLTIMMKLFFKVGSVHM